MQGKKHHFWIDRRHERLNIDLACRVGAQQDDLHEARILNLSAGGLKFSCTEETVLRLLPEGQRTPGLVSDVTIVVRFQLPLPGRKTPAAIHTSAGIIHTERLAQDIYHVGAQFLGLRDSDRKSLQTYIEENRQQTEARGY
jgi:hypothetical protein